ncbi:unnamed protein product [Calicophoron daubneyi]|uniref:ATP-dependent RNA helicase n=1 Tax=Calicophoron daubneyi TaxID=300641 RepID=A0AAV2T5Q1_CALDB
MSDKSGGQVGSCDQYDSLKKVNPLQLSYFSQLPLSKPIVNNLKSNGFTKLTEVQKLAIRQVLLGDDVVVEAPTGSGKTLAYLIPMLDRLIISRVTTYDGPVVVILTPTRELARQVSLVLKRLCSGFKFTMLDIMGGKSNQLKKQEWNSICRANILVGTPGRLVQHQTENPLLDLSNVKMLILDEADRLLDPTFQNEMDTIVNNITPDRQTMLFSATQSSTASHLSRLGLKNPVILSTKSPESTLMPVQLHQSYVVVPLEKKLDCLWTLLQSHCKKKIIVFFSTQKQVRFVYELFQLLRPFYRMLQLRGNMSQPKRFQVYDRFASTPTGCVLLATNVAERGLDFPTVHLVIQADCPHSVDEYIHRSGRTARSGQTGRVITFLLPSELEFVELIQERGVTIKLQKFPETPFSRPVSSRAGSLLAAKQDLAGSARCAFRAYLRDYCLVAGSPKDRLDPSKCRSPTAKVFDPTALPLDAFVSSLGLVSMPDLPARCQQWFHFKSDTRSADEKQQAPPDRVVSVPWALTDDLKPETLSADLDDGADDFLVRKPEYASRKAFALTITDNRKLLDLVEDSSTDSESKSETVFEPKSNLAVEIKPKSRKLTHIQRAKRELKRKHRSYAKTVFDDSGQVVRKLVGDIPVFDAEKMNTELTDVYTSAPSHGTLDVEVERKRLHQTIDKEDKKSWKLRLKEKNRLRRKKLKEARKQLQQPAPSATL